MNEENKVTIVGYVGKYSISGVSVNNNPYYYGKLNIKVDNFDKYADIKAFGDVAQQLERLIPNSKIKVEGHVNTSEDKKLSELLGRKYFSTFIDVDSFTELDNNSDDRYSSIDFGI